MLKTYFLIKCSFLLYGLILKNWNFVKKLWVSLFKTFNQPLLVNKQILSIFIFWDILIKSFLLFNKI